MNNSLVSSVAFNTNLASGSNDNTIKLWNVETKTILGLVAFNTNGTILASGSDDNTIKLWNVETCNTRRA